MDDDDIDLSPEMSERERAIRVRVRRLAEFYRHATVYLIVNLLLWALNAAMIQATGKPFPDPMQWWSYWVTAFWGIGLACHAAAALPRWSFFSSDWEDRKVREIMKRNAP